MGERLEDGTLRLEDSRADWVLGWHEHWKKLALNRLHSHDAVRRPSSELDLYIAEHSAEVRVRLDYLLAQRGTEGNVERRAFGPAE